MTEETERMLSKTSLAFPQPPMRVVIKGWWVLRERTATIDEIAAEKRSYARLGFWTRVRRQLILLIRPSMTSYVTRAEVEAEMKAGKSV